MSEDREGRGAAESTDGVVRMSSFAAFGWALGATLAFFGVTLLFAILSRMVTPTSDLTISIAMGFLQLAIYGPAVVLIRGGYMRRIPLGAALGFRRAPIVLCALAVVIGATATIWEDALFQLAQRYWPLPEGADQVGLGEDAPLVPAMIRLAQVALLTPFTEELLFRGGLMRPLMPKRSWVEPLFITALLFSMAHLRWQYAAPIFPLALCIGGLRILSGSIVPSILLHATFNITGIVIMVLGGARFITLPVLLGSIFTSLLAAWGALKLGEKHPTAVRNRQEEAA